MRKTLLLLIILLFGSNISAQTNVSGPYFTNTTWTLSRSPYNIVGNVQIPKDVILTIEPGVQINYNSDFEILVKGSIISNGTINNYIVFNGNIIGKSMIIFKSTNLSTSQLSFIKFNGPKDAFQLADETQFNEDLIKNSGILNVSDCIISNTNVKSKGYQSGAKLSIFNSKIISTNITGVYARSEVIELKSCNIDKSVINSDSYNEGIFIDNGVVENSTLKIGCCNANLNITKTKLINSSIVGGNDSPQDGFVKISDSELDKTFLNLPFARIEIVGSIINYNTPTALVIGSGNLQCSQIIGNGIGTALELTGFPQGYGNLYVITSKIDNNAVGIKITNGNNVNIVNSNFTNNITYNLQNLSIKNILANDNWWGTSSSQEIGSKIYDYYKDINLGIVDYSNYLNSEYDISNCLLLLNTNQYNNEFKKAVIYPNPNYGLVKINLGDLNNVSVKVFNQIGQLVYIKDNISSYYEFEIKEAPGLYLIELESNNQKQYYKLVKQ